MIPGVCAWIFVVLRTKPKVSSSLVKVSLRVGSSPGSSISRTRGTVELYLPHLRRSRCSIAGSVSRRTLPTTSRLRAETLSSVSAAVCQGGYSESIRSAAGTPARRKGAWACSTGSLSGRKCAPRPRRGRGRELDQEGGARATVVRPDEADVADPLGVIVTADQDHVGPSPRQHGDDVGHREASVRCLRLEGLHAGGDGGGAQLTEDVRARPRGRRRTGRPRPERHDALEVAQGRGAVEGRRRPRRARAEGEGAERQQDGAPGPHGLTPTAP